MNSKKNISYGVVSTTEEFGGLVRQHRKSQKVCIQDVSDISLLGARFISEFERGKETCQIGKILKLLKFLGLEIRIVPRGSQ